MVVVVVVVALLGLACLAQRVSAKNYVVISVDQNPFYSFFAPLTTFGWSRLMGFHPIVFVVPGVQTLIRDAVRDMGGIVVELDSAGKLAGTPESTLMQTARLYAAALPFVRPNDTIITGDADMMPLGREYFEQSKDTRPGEILVLGNHPATLKHNQYPMCYLSMQARTWGTVMEFSATANRGGGAVEDAMRRVLAPAGESAHRWTFDQTTLYDKVQRWERSAHERDGGARKIVLVPWRNRDRLDFRVKRDVTYAPSREWIDSHMLRPGFTKRNWPRLKDGLLLHICDATTMSYFDTYRARFVKHVMDGDDVAASLRDGMGRKQ